MAETPDAIEISISEFVGQYVNYFTRDRLISDRKRQIGEEYAPDTGNGIRYLSEMALAAKRTGHLSIGIRDEINTALFACQRVGSLGLYKRNPAGTFGMQTHDDLTGIAMISVLIDRPSIAKNVLLYCRTKKLWGFIPYYYNSENPESFSWKGLFLWTKPGLVAALHMAAKEKLSWYLAILWKLTVWIGRLGNPEPDGWCLSCQLVVIAKLRNQFPDHCKEFSDVFKRKLPGGYGQALSMYIHDGSSHPNAVNLQNEYGA